MAKQIPSQKAHATFARRIPLKRNIQIEYIPKFKWNSDQSISVNRLAKHTLLRKTLSLRHGAVSPRVLQDPTFNRTLLGTRYVIPINTMGKVANPGEASNSRKRKHKVGYPTRPTHVRLPTEPKYEMAIEDATEHAERDRQIRKNPLISTNHRCRHLLWRQAIDTM